MQVCITGHARAYQALEVAAGTPKRVKRDGSVTPPEEECAKFYVGVVDVNRCNWVLVATNTLETLEKCDEVPTELLPVTGEVRDGVTLKGCYFCPKHTVKILEMAQERNTGLHVSLSVFEYPMLKTRAEREIVQKRMRDVSESG